jgi:NTE family protein
MRKPKRVALVLGAGGITGGAWLAGALSALAAVTGWEPRSADLIVGTSAGSVMAALLACGLSARQLMPLHDRPADAWPLRDMAARQSYSGSARQNLAPGSLGALISVLNSTGSWTRGARLLCAIAPRGRVPTEPIRRVVARMAPAGWAPHPACWIVTTDYRSGRRVVFGRDKMAGLAEAVAASCAIPGIFDPVPIEGRDYVDGGLASPTNADLAAEGYPDVVLCLNPLAIRPEGRSFNPAAHVEALVRRSASRQLDCEIVALKSRGIGVIRIEPGADDLAGIGLDPMDPTKAIEIAARAAHHARTQVDAFARILGPRRESARPPDCGPEPLASGWVTGAL